MSRALSSARSAFERANVHLEDVLLGELESGIGGSTIPHVADRLEESLAFLSDLRCHLGRLRADMNEHGYRDLSVTIGIDVRVVSRVLADAGLGSSAAFARIAELWESGGFYAVLDHFDQQVNEILQRTDDLRVKVSVLTSEERQHRVTKVLENNLPGNIKVEFARLYSAWNSYQETFLASSMVSTELWYRSINVGSLLEVVETTFAAA